MARQKYSDEEIDFISEQLENSEKTKGEITEEFLKNFPESGRKIKNIKQKITKMAADKNVELKDRVRAEARSVLGNGKMSAQNTVNTINALLLGQLLKKAAKPLAWEPGAKESDSAEQALFKTFVPAWAQAELHNARCQSIGAKQPRLEMESTEDEISEAEAPAPATCVITAMASLAILTTTWHDNEKFHMFLWKLPADRFELDVKVTNSGNAIEISFKRLLPTNDSLMKIAREVLGLQANQIMEIGNFANAYKAMDREGKIRVMPTRQVLSTDHMKVANVNDITCLTFPFFDVEKKENGGKKKI